MKSCVIHNYNGVIKKAWQ